MCPMMAPPITIPTKGMIPKKQPVAGQLATPKAMPKTQKQPPAMTKRYRVEVSMSRWSKSSATTKSRT